MVKKLGIENRFKWRRKRLRESGGENETTLRYGVIEMQVRARSVTCAGVRVELKRLEFAILQLFLEQPERILSRAEIKAAMYRDRPASKIPRTDTADLHVQHLRKKLGECDTMILTIMSRGYMLQLTQERETEEE